MELNEQTTKQITRENLEKVMSIVKQFEAIRLTRCSYEERIKMVFRALYDVRYGDIEDVEDLKGLMVKLYNLDECIQEVLKRIENQTYDKKRKIMGDFMEINERIKQIKLSNAAKVNAIIYLKREEYEKAIEDAKDALFDAYLEGNCSDFKDVKSVEDLRKIKESIEKLDNLAKDAFEDLISKIEEKLFE